MHRLSDRIKLARRQHFVGRVAEIALFRAALLADEPTFTVLHIYGPGGVGKTTLLHELARIAVEHGRPIVHLDGRHLEVAASALEAALQPLATTPRAVLILDTYELLESLDGELRGRLLPQLSDDVVIVIAGRHAPTAWLGDSDWAAITRVVALGNLESDDSQTLLTARGVPRERHEAALDFTRGHPLALSLVADLYSQRPGGAPAALAGERDVLRLLLERFVQDAPSQQHREALELCALARSTTEDLLASYFDAPSAVSLFGWLRQLSMIEHGPYGIFPHDLVRDVLEADLHWRSPARYNRMRGRVLRYLRQQIAASSGVEQQRLRMDVLFLDRRAPGIGPFFAWNAVDSAYAERARPDDFPAIFELVERYEGAESAAIARHWQQRQPESFLTYRTAGGALYGFMLQLALDRVTAADGEIDPAVEAALRVVEANRPPAAGTAISYMRFWMGRDSYQAVSPVINITAANCVIHWTTTPALVWSFVAMSDPEFMAPHFESIQFRRIPAADFVVDGRRYGVFGHDWIAEPVEPWVVGTRHADEALPLPSQVTMTERECGAAVRQALRDFTRPDLLVGNPLLHSALLSGEARTAAELQALLREAIEALRHNPKDAKLYRALWHTYVEPEASQERVAERLDLPFNTYRYHLANGLERLSTYLWQRMQQAHFRQ